MACMSPASKVGPRRGPTWTSDRPILKNSANGSVALSAVSTLLCGPSALATHRCGAYLAVLIGFPVGSAFEGYA